MDSPLPNLKSFILNISLVTKFGLRFLKKYTKANLIKTHLTYSSQCNKYIITEGSYLVNDIDIWTINNHLHRDNGPALIQYDSNMQVVQYFEYRQYGKLDRLDGPAIYKNDGTRMWCRDGWWHRIDGPAIIKTDGSKEWFVDGRRHREDGPAFKTARGTLEWYINGKLHRIDGPAIYEPLSNGNFMHKWYLNGKCHRIDGPAVTVNAYNATKGIIHEEWWQNGERIYKKSLKKRAVVIFVLVCISIAICYFK